MSHHDHSDRGSGSEGSWWRSRGGIVLVALLAIGGFLLFTEHRAHVFSYGLFFLLLACPLLHLFMHGGHSGHAGEDAASRSDRGPERSEP